MKFEEAYQKLLDLPRYDKYGPAAYAPGFDRIRALLSHMSDPHDGLPFVHVAGTNGKGSTASFLSAIARVAGLRVGLHTSPHVYEVTERIRVDGIPASLDWLAAQVSQLGDAIESVRPTFFEVTFALSMRYFAERDVDVAIVEVGLGGRLDATNIINPQLSIITAIGFDHVSVLGDTLEEIALEKAGIIKPGVPVVVARNSDSVEEVIRRKSAERDAAAIFVSEVSDLSRVEVNASGTRFDMVTSAQAYRELESGLSGRHQVDNAATAIVAAEMLQWASPEAIAQGLRDVVPLSGIRGRLEPLGSGSRVTLDVAHNPEGIRAALAYVAGGMPLGGRLHVAAGLMRDKDAAGYVDALKEARATVYPIEIPSERALSAEDFAAVASSAGLVLKPPGGVNEALQAFLRTSMPEDRLLITGSHQVVAAVKRPALRGTL